MTRSSKVPDGAEALADKIVAMLLALLALVVYVATLCPTIFTDDCGEIATAVATGGVMHPPGYPLYCILGGLFVRLVPFGEPAFRLGLLSCICASAATGISFLICRRLGAGRAWSVCGAFVFAFSFALWQQATKVETYALNAAFVGCLLLLASDFERTGETRRFYILAAVGGLALTNHLTTLWLIPAVLVIALPKLIQTNGGGRATGIVCVAALAAALPLTLYGYEMVAARAHPAGQIWGDPSTLHRLLLHVTGVRYQDLFHWPTLNWLYRRDVLFAIPYLWRNLGPMLVLGLLGVRAAIRIDETRRLTIGLWAGVGLYITCNTFYHILNIFEYYTPVVLMISALGAAGGQRLTDWAAAKFPAPDARRPLAMLQGAAVILALTIPVMINWRSCNRHGAVYMRDLAENTLASLPPDSLLVAYGDNEVFPIWYAQEVLHERPDVTLVPRNFFLEWASPNGRDIDSWCINRIEREHPETHVCDFMKRAAVDPDYAHSGGALWDVVRCALTRHQPVFFTCAAPGDLESDGHAAQELAHIPGTALVSEGVVCRVFSIANEPTAQHSLAVALNLEPHMRIAAAPPELFEYDPDKDLTNKIYAGFLTTVGQLLTDNGQYSRAYQRLSLAFEMDPTAPRTADEYAYLSALFGRKDDAVDAWRIAERVDPGNPNYARNIATALGQPVGSEKSRG